AAALGAFVGHVAPVWLGFKGGKGVATFLGTLIAVAWPAAIVFALVWLGLAFALRYSSLSALAASAASPLALLAMGQPRAALVFAVLAAILWWKHSENIKRLREGRETRIGAKG
ncbi:glycerol-3-phosphate acyltransferase, partial [Nostoc sp. NIES-2111]